MNSDKKKLKQLLAARQNPSSPVPPSSGRATPVEPQAATDKQRLDVRDLLEVAAREFSLERLERLFINADYDDVRQAAANELRRRAADTDTAELESPQETVSRSPECPNDGSSRPASTHAVIDLQTRKDRLSEILKGAATTVAELETFLTLDSLKALEIYDPHVPRREEEILRARHLELLISSHEKVHPPVPCVVRLANGRCEILNPFLAEDLIRFEAAGRSEIISCATRGSHHVNDAHRCESSSCWWRNSRHQLLDWIEANRVDKAAAAAGSQLYDTLSEFARTYKRPQEPDETLSVIARLGESLSELMTEQAPSWLGRRGRQREET